MAEKTQEYSFTLMIQGDAEESIDDLFEAGCDDATFGEVDGIAYADFDREGATLGEAVVSAVRDVESVGGLRVRRVEPDDLVTISEIAQRLGRSRESVRLLVSGERGPGKFPAPVSHLRSRNRLWRWSDVVAYSGISGLNGVSVHEAKEEIQRANMVAALNAALELRAGAAHLPQRERELVAALEDS